MIGLAEIKSVRDVVSLVATLRAAEATIETL